MLTYVLSKGIEFYFEAAVVERARCSLDTPPRQEFTYSRTPGRARTHTHTQFHRVVAVLAATRALLSRRSEN